MKKWTRPTKGKPRSAGIKVTRPVKLNIDDEIDFLDRAVGSRERFALEVLRKLNPGRCVKLGHGDSTDQMVKDVCTAAARHLCAYFAFQFVIRRGEKK